MALDSFLDSGPEVVNDAPVAESGPVADEGKVEQEPAPETEPAPDESEPDPEKGVKEEEDSEPPSEDEPDNGKPPPKHVPYAALKQARAERQQLKQRIAELERQAGGGTQQQNQQNQQAPQKGVPLEFWQGPAEAHAELRGEVDALREESRRERALIERRALTRYSHMAAKREFSDYDEVIAELTEKAQADPVLNATVERQIDASDDPARTAYEFALALREFSGIGNIADYKKTLRATVTREVEAKLRKEAALKAAKDAPKSLASVRGGGTKTAPPERDLTLGEITKR